MKNLSVLHLQFSTKSAGSCAIRLHRGFLNYSKHKSSVLSLINDEIPFEDVNYLPFLARIYAKINNRLESYLFKYNKSKHGLFSNPLLSYPIKNHKLVKKADVIYVHWVMMGFMSFNSLKSLMSTKKKIIIFMHDMWYMTGGCHYAIDCSGFKSLCLNCPIFPMNNNVACYQLLNKNVLYQKFSNLYFVSPSIWLKRLGNESSLLSDKTISFIPNYFNSDIFKPLDRNFVRKELGLPIDKKIIVFGAVSIDSPYKGWEYLKLALVKLSGKYNSDELEVLVFGEVNNNLSNLKIGFKINFMGYLQDEVSISKAYNASDVFVLPSTIDNQPTTVIESLNCGIPVVAFDLGGTPEMIDHKYNGYIARPFDSDDLASGIDFCLTTKLNVYVKEEYHPKQVMNRHEELLKTIQYEDNH